MKGADQATRCPACKTVFRVVSDQLRVSEGWVRCGRCANVFNASEHIMDMDGGWARLSAAGSAGGFAGGFAGDAAGPAADDSADTAAQDSAGTTSAEPEDWPAITPPDAPNDPPLAARDVPARAESWRLPQAATHRARQDGPDNDRLASKIEAAMSRSQLQPRPASQAAQAAPAPVSGLTFRRPTAAALQPMTPLDFAAPAASPFPAGLAPPAPSHFDETRPESAWPQTVVAHGLDDLRADPKPLGVQNAAAPSMLTKPGFMRKAEREQHWRRPHM